VQISNSMFLFLFVSVPTLLLGFVPLFFSRGKNPRRASLFLKGVSVIYLIGLYMCGYALLGPRHGDGMGALLGAVVGAVVMLVAAIIGLIGVIAVNSGHRPTSSSMQPPENGSPDGT
jgi:hypothetical protein